MDEECIYCQGTGIRHNGYLEYPCNKCQSRNGYFSLGKDTVPEHVKNYDSHPGWTSKDTNTRVWF